MDYRGRQIFIVHPDSKVRDKWVWAARYREFETFGITESNLEMLSESHDAVVLLNTRSDEKERRIISNIAQISHPRMLVAVGKEVPPDGFNLAIPGGDDVVNRIIGFLEESGAQGHRNFVRFGSQNASIASFEYHLQGRRFAGVVHDLSVAGMSCTFLPEPEILGHLPVEGLLLNLPGYRAVLSGQFTTSRTVLGHPIHVFLFAKNLPMPVRGQLYAFIYSSLETKFSSRTKLKPD